MFQYFSVFQNLSSQRKKRFETMGIYKTSVVVTLCLITAAIPSFAVQPLYGQCGGTDYTGDTECVSGTTCTRLSDWFYQCLSATPTTTSTGPSPPPSYTELPTNSTCVSLPIVPSLTPNPRLNDPFRFADGRRVTNKIGWACRRGELMNQLSGFELGTLPPKPTGLSASYSNGKLSIKVTQAGNSISFEVLISAPTGSSAPYPAIISFGGSSIPTDGVALITYNNGEIAAQEGPQSRGKGKFYTLYGSSHSAGALIAWTWGVSRIIDALEITTGHNIDTKRIGVTGCSSNARGVMVAGAFDSRIALTIPQESGTGGAGCWRIAERLYSTGPRADMAKELVQQNVWFSKDFETYINQINILPFDHHLLAALIAPRALLVIDNSSVQSLGPQSVWGCMLAANKVYQSLGVANSMGISIIGNTNRCSLTSSQKSNVSAFIRRFLFRQSADTNVIRNDDPNNFGYNETLFVDWSVPALAGSA
ncbi:hypothetical protein BJ165DRAFT_1406285 [Panaeolus papilionaceus]|nr:hypothetical protein BJ165DRAFT_1406285 [Panaeolus papilionaceus]